MQEPLVSIIVPIYKVEPYLRRCLDSIVNQTYTNLEIILVDDGSPDGCPMICDEYAAKDNRIVVIHKDNGGLSDARNAGLDVCKGDYISFVDSDDWVEMDYVGTLFELLNKNNADISIINFKKTTSDTPNPYERLKSRNINKLEILDSEKSASKLFSSDETIFVIACCKLYKKHLFSEIRFPKGKKNEDEYVAYKLLYTSKKTVFQDIPLYNYFQHSGSIMANIGTDSLRIFDAHLERYIFFKTKKVQKLLQLCLRSLCWDTLFAYSKLSQGESVIFFSNKKDALSEHRKYVSEYAAIGKWSIEKLALIFFATFPHAYLLYRKISPYKIRKS